MLFCNFVSICFVSLLHMLLKMQIYKVRLFAYFQNTFVNAFLGERTDIIQQILSRQKNFKLTEEQFTQLCQAVITHSRYIKKCI